MEITRFAQGWGGGGEGWELWWGGMLHPFGKAGADTVEAELEFG